MISIHVTPPASRSEQKVFTALEATPGVMLTNFRVMRGRGNREVDALVVTPAGVFVVEVKGTGATGWLHAPANGNWTVGDDPAPFSGTPANPGDQADRAAKSVKHALTDAGINPGFVPGLVIVDGDGVEMPMSRSNGVVTVRHADEITGPVRPDATPIDVHTALKIITAFYADADVTIADLYAEGFTDTVQPRQRQETPTGDPHRARGGTQGTQNSQAGQGPNGAAGATAAGAAAGADTDTAPSPEPTEIADYAIRQMVPQPLRILLGPSRSLFARLYGPPLFMIVMLIAAVVHTIENGATADNFAEGLGLGFFVALWALVLSLPRLLVPTPVLWVECATFILCSKVLVHGMENWSVLWKLLGALPAAFIGVPIACGLAAGVIYGLAALLTWPLRLLIQQIRDRRSAKPGTRTAGKAGSGSPGKELSTLD